MANQLDLQEQEQIDELKAFWKEHGNLITWVLVLALLVFAGWNGWRWWERTQAEAAAGLFEELDKAVLAGDAARVGRAFSDLKDRYPRTVFAQQGALMAARVQADKGQADAARAALAWVADNGAESEYKVIARLRLAGLLMEAKQYDEALKQLDGAKAPEFDALVADRRGDILLAQGKPAEAQAAYAAAYKAMDEKLDYRRLIEAKLTALGAAPAASGATP
jgi:predicted negative regulator of RcsB-dependent stress response